MTVYGAGLAWSFRDEVAPRSRNGTDMSRSRIVNNHAQEESPVLRRAQLLHVVAGALVAGSCAQHDFVPTGHALWLPPGQECAVRLVGAAELISISLAPTATDVIRATPRVIKVEPLLAQLIASAVEATTRRRMQLLSRVIFIELDRAPDACLRLPMPTSPALVDLSLYLLAHPSWSASGAELGVHLGMGTKALTRQFRRETGVALHDWSRRARLLSSIPALMAGRPLDEVAREHGYRAASTFSAAFRRAMSMSPRSLRTAREEIGASSASPQRPN